MQVDLPALDRPTKAISGTSILGRCLSSGAVVRNLAVCSQPMAIFGSGTKDAAVGGKEVDKVEEGDEGEAVMAG